MLPRVSSLRGLATRLRPLGASQGVPTRRKLSTLDPARLTVADFVDLSGKKILHRHKPRLDVPFVHKPGEYLPFPPHTQGFFYFSPGPHHAPVTGEVRFRITSDPDPAGFAGGRDLCLPGQPTPWGVPLLNILKSKTCYKLLQELLTNRDESVSADLATAVREHKSPYLTRNTHLIHSLGQPFLHDLSWQTLNFRVALGPRIYDVVHLALPVEGRHTHNNYKQPVYTGKVICCLEALNHQGRQALALRILEVIEPARPTHEDYDGWAPAPVAGELLKTGGGDTWAHMLHESQASSSNLRALLSNTPGDGYISRGLPRQKSPGMTEPGTIRCVQNLDPKKLAATDWVDLSLLKDTSAHFLDEPSGVRGRLAHITYSLDSDQGVTVFPAGTTGFFYVHVPSPDHPIGAQLRFRRVSDPDPAAFEAGHDLRTARDTVWYQWLPELVSGRRSPAADAIARIAARQGLVAPAVIERWQHANRAEAGLAARGPLVCPESEPFAWDFARATRVVILGVGPHARVVQIRSPFRYPGRSKQSVAESFTGQARVRLEEDGEKKTYHLRVLGVFNLEPVPGRECTLPAPRAGDLIKLGAGPRVYKTMQEMRQNQ